MEFPSLESAMRGRPSQSDQNESLFFYREKCRGSMSEEDISVDRKKYRSSIDHHKNEKFIRYML